MPKRAQKPTNEDGENASKRQREPKQSKAVLFRLYRDHCLEKQAELPDLPVHSNAEFPPLTKVEPQPRAFVQQCLANGAQGDGELFAALFKGRVVCQERIRGYQWYLWNGLHWVSNGTLSLVKLLTRYVKAEYCSQARELEAEAEEQDTGEQAVESYKSLARVLIERAIALGQNPHRLLEFAAPLLNCPELQWNEAIELLPCLNGTVDMRTGELRAAMPSDRFTFACPVEWKGLDEKAVRFEAALLQILNDNQEAFDCLQRVLGYALSGCNREDLIVILRGALGRNGKGWLLAVLKAALGPTFAKELSPDVVLSKGPSNAGAATPHLASLEAVRIGYVDEANPEHAGHRFNASQIKRLTGARDKILTRPLYEAERAFQALYTLFCLLNDLPEVDPNDSAFWERVYMFDFPLQFVDQPIETYQRKRDPDLAKAITAEHSGVVAWLVRGYMAYLKLGIAPPECVQKGRQEYRQDVDTFAQWLVSECEISPTAECSLANARAAHDSWNKCQTSAKQFAALLKQERVIAGQRIRFQNVKDSGGYMVWRGFALKKRVDSSYPL